MSSVNWEELSDAFKKFFKMRGYGLDEDRHVNCPCVITDEEVKAAIRAMIKPPKAKVKFCGSREEYILQDKATKWRAIPEDDKVRLERQ